jgi:hypothetical protein
MKKIFTGVAVMGLLMMKEIFVGVAVIGLFTMGCPTAPDSTAPNPEAPLS